MENKKSQKTHPRNPKDIVASDDTSLQFNRNRNASSNYNADRPKRENKKKRNYIISKDEILNTDNRKWITNEKKKITMVSLTKKDDKRKASYQNSKWS